MPVVFAPREGGTPPTAGGSNAYDVVTMAELDQIIDAVNAFSGTSDEVADADTYANEINYLFDAAKEATETLGHTMGYLVAEDNSLIRMWNWTCPVCGAWGTAKLMPGFGMVPLTLGVYANDGTPTETTMFNEILGTAVTEACS